MNHSYKLSNSHMYTSLLNQGAAHDGDMDEIESRLTKLRDTTTEETR